LNYKLVL